MEKTVVVKKKQKTRKIRVPVESVEDKYKGLSEFQIIQMKSQILIWIGMLMKGFGVVLQLSSYHLLMVNRLQFIRNGVLVS